MESSKESTEKRGPGRPPTNKVLGKILADEPEEKKENPVIATSKNLTPEERAIFGRVMGQSDEWRTITEEETNDYSLSRDIFDLPEPAKKLVQNKEFAFRWITRKSERLDEIKNRPIPFRWWPVNMNQPVGMIFKPFIDPNNGCVSREDQMLVFKPWWMSERELNYKRKLADSADQSKRLDSRDGEIRVAGRDTEVEIKAGMRKGTDTKPLRQEIQGSDVQFRGEEEMDISMGRSFPTVSESDLTVEE